MLLSILLAFAGSFSTARAQTLEAATKPLVLSELVGHIAGNDIYVHFDELCCMSGQTDLSTEVTWVDKKSKKKTTHELGNGSAGGKRRTAVAFTYKDYLVLGGHSFYGRFDEASTGYSWDWYQFDKAKQSFYDRYGSCSISIDKPKDKKLRAAFDKAMSEDRLFDAKLLLDGVIKDEMYSGYLSRYEFPPNQPPAEEVRLIERQRDLIAHKLKSEPTKAGTLACRTVHDLARDWMTDTRDDGRQAYGSSEDESVDEAASKNDDETTPITPRESDSRVVALGDLGYFLQQTGYQNEAVRVLKRVLEISPDRSVTQLNLADAFWDLGKTTEAKENYRAYIANQKLTKKTEEAIQRAKSRLKSTRAIKSASLKECPERLLSGMTRKNFSQKLTQFLKEGGHPDTYIDDENESDVKNLVGKAVYLGDVGALQKLIDSGASLSLNVAYPMAKWENKPPLVIAIQKFDERNRLQIIDLLLKHGAMKGLETDIVEQMRTQTDPVPTLKRLLAAGAKPDFQKLIQPIFSDAPREFWATLLAHLHLQPKALEGENGYSVLHLATIAEAAPLMKILVDSGLDVNALTPALMTAKDFAARFEKKELLAALGPEARLAQELAVQQPKKFASERKRFEGLPQAIKDLIDERERKDNRNGETANCPPKSLPSYITNGDTL